ncbi:MAG: Lrp/AsnC family transcriptional regulator [Bacteroidales bacterium]|nr:Lrp/AsnC family transcriptional regulator [Bacteroidales bacterium]
MTKLDATDLLILRTLQANCNLTSKELAQKVHLSPTPVYERVKRMEREGIIKQYIAVIDAELVGHGFSVFCAVKLKNLSHKYVEDFTNGIKDIKEVTECYNVSGEYDYMLKIMVPDMKAYQHFILNVLGQMESLGSLTSMFVMDEIKHSYGYLI